MFDGVHVSETARKLIAARALIEKGWCQGKLARDSAGRQAAPTLSAARSWCAIGALQKVDGALAPDIVCVNALFCVTGEPLDRWNDDSHRTKEEVLAAFDRAIALAMTET